MEKDIILASASPRRIEILREKGIFPQIIPADVDETIPAGTPPHLACMLNALRKVLAVEKDLADAGREGIIIGADTIVCMGDVILGKPADEEDAFSMLSSLRGSRHVVMTGLAVCDAGKSHTRVYCEKTWVTFGDYSDDDIRAYIRTGEPMDKAGSYAIQGQWSKHIVSTEGDYYNVIGLPFDLLSGVLKDHFDF